MRKLEIWQCLLYVAVFPASTHCSSLRFLVELSGAIAGDERDVLPRSREFLGLCSISADESSCRWFALVLPSFRGK